MESTTKDRNRPQIEYLAASISSALDTLSIGVGHVVDLDKLEASFKTLLELWREDRDAKPANP